MKHLDTRYFLSLTAFVSLFFFAGCDNNDPAKEDVPELITEVTLKFTTEGVTGGGSSSSSTAIDPDGDGPQGLIVDSPINLNKSQNYRLDITLINGLADPASDEYDLTGEVAAEGTEHMFFFGWTTNLFASPTGNGNIDNRADAVDYRGPNSKDGNGLPLGLATLWTTPSSPTGGTFRVVLKHLPGLKTETSGVDIGETDLDVAFSIEIK
jgi:hypothetical protein